MSRAFHSNTMQLRECYVHTTPKLSIRTHAHTHTNIKVKSIWFQSFDSIPMMKRKSIHIQIASIYSLEMKRLISEAVIKFYRIEVKLIGRFLCSMEYIIEHIFDIILKNRFFLKENSKTNTRKIFIFSSVLVAT